MASGLRLSPWALVGLAFCVGCLGFVKGGKVLVIPLDGSHWLSIREVIQELSLRGHESVVLAPELSLYVREGQYYTLRTFPVKFSKDRFQELMGSDFQLVFDPKPSLKRFFDIAMLLKRIADMYVCFCTDLFYNKELMKSLEEAHYDVVLTDSANPCGPILAHYLSITAVYFLRGLPCGLDTESTQCPDPPSYIPRLTTENADQMTFLQREKNILYPLPQNMVRHFYIKPYGNLASEMLQRDTSLVDVLSHGSVWLFRTDFVFDYPKPIMPNMVFIGGINCASAKQLSQLGMGHVCQHCRCHPVG